MRGIPDTQKSRPEPSCQPIDSDGQKANIFPITQLFHAVLQEGIERGDFLPKRFQPPLPDFISCTFRDNESALPIILAINQKQNPATIKMAKSLRWIGEATAKPHPHDIHWRAEIDDLQPCPLPDHRVAGGGGGGGGGAGVESDAAGPFAE